VPVGTSSDITSKSGFFANLFELDGQLKRFLRCRVREIFNGKPLELTLGLMQNDMSYYLLTIRRRISASSFGCVIMTPWPAAMVYTFHLSLRALAAKGSIHDEKYPSVQCM
jgi:hypothetical protein